MRVIEEKKDKLKAVISHIICETPSVYNVIKNQGGCPNPKFIVLISKDNNSYGNKSNCEVKLGMGNLSKLCDICNHFYQLYHFEYSISNNILEFHSDDEFCIDCHDISDKELDNIEFLEDDSIGSVGTLVIYALAFTIFHEFGHVKYDDDSMLQIEKERTADLFAMGIAKEECVKYPDIQIDKNPAFLGALLNVILILNVSDPKFVEIKESHPHPVERLYLLLEYFHIDEESYLWKYTYDMVANWLKEHHLSMTYEKDCSISIKDKLLDAYLRFKK